MMRYRGGRLLVSAGCGIILLALGLAVPWRFVSVDGVRPHQPVAERARTGSADLPDRIGEAKRLRESRLLARTGSLLAEYEHLRALPDEIEVFRRSSELENKFADELDPKSASYLIQCMPEGFVDTRFGAIALAKWAASARLEAGRWMAEHPGKSATAGEALARGWFGEDRAALQSHLDELPPGPWKTQLAVTAGEDAFLAKDPQTAAAFLKGAEIHDPRRLQLLEWNATSWAIRDTDAATAWAAGEPDAGRRETLLAAVAIGRANVSPEDAAAGLFQNVTSRELLVRSVEAIARVWASRDPQGALTWVERLPDGDIRRTAGEALSSIPRLQHSDHVELRDHAADEGE